MTKSAKIAVLTFVMAFGFQGIGDLQAQSKKAVFKQPSFKQLPAAKNTKSLKAVRPGASVSRGGNSRGLRSPNNVLPEDNRFVERLPDSRLPKKETPATPRSVLKKRVL